MNNSLHRPFVYIAGALSLGILLARFVPVSFGVASLEVIMSLFAAVMFSRERRLATGMLLLAIVGLGMIMALGRAYVPKKDIQYLARYYRKSPIELEGVIISDVQDRLVGRTSKKMFTLKACRVKAPWGWRPKSGKVLVNLFGDDDLAYGDYLRLMGKLHRPYNFSSDKNFSYRDYLAGRGIRYVLSVKKDAPVKILARGQGNSLKAASFKVRARLKSLLKKNLSLNEAGVMAAILLGDRSSIARPIRTLFAETGTAHILAISGLHMGIVAALFLAMAKILPLGRRGQLFLVIILLLGYAFMAGGRPSVVRATAMAVIFLASFIVEKEFDTMNALCLSAAIILAANPLSLFDCGFQLSFTCVFAILYADALMKKLGPRSRQRPEGFRRESWRAVIIQSLWISASIWVAVAGLIAYYFGMITPITVIANIMVIPLISVIVGLGFGLLLSGLILPFGAVFFAVCLKVVLNLMVGAIFLLNKVPFSHIIMREVRLGHVLIYYMVVLLAVFISGRFILPRPPRSGRL